LKYFALCVYVIVQIVFIPLAIIGVLMVAYRQMITSRKLGVSSTAIEVINGRWTMDVFGLREDSAARGLNAVLPNTSVAGLWLALFPLYLFYRMTGNTLLYPKVPSEGEEGIADLVVARTIYIDEIIERSRVVAEQFVVLGAGFDTRAYGDLKSDELRFFELDQASTQQLKRTCLERARISTDHVTFIEIDFEQEDWCRKLEAAGFDSAKKTIFLWEGVSLYLGRADVCDTLTRIKELAAEGSVIVADFYAQSFVSGEYARGMKAATKSLKLTDEELGFGLDFSKSHDETHDETLLQFVASLSLYLHERKFLAADSSKGPYMVVAQMLL
jgi:methyltransferase (TIGR00027 family)